MKTSLVALLLALSAVASSQDAATAQPQAAQTSAAQPQQKKEIKDPAEYNAYVGAVQQNDPAAKISGLEAFLTQYPNSIVKKDALEVTFTCNLNSASVTDPSNWSAERWDYRYTGSYGSPEFWPDDPKHSGHEPVTLSNIVLLEDKRTARLSIPDLKPVNQLRLRFSIKAADGTSIQHEIYQTIHQVPSA